MTHNDARNPVRAAEFPEATQILLAVGSGERAERQSRQLQVIG